MIQNKEIIRKLGSKESAYLKVSRTFTLSFHIKSKIDLFRNLDSVKTAIHKWKFKYPLLRAQISQCEHDQDFYFVHDPRHHLRDNVKFLKLNTSSKQTQYDENELDEVYT
jgi:hypothetical protein